MIEFMEELAEFNNQPIWQVLITLRPEQMSEYLARCEEKKGGEGMWVANTEVMTFMKTTQSGGGLKSGGRGLISNATHALLVNCKKRSVSEKAMTSLRGLYFAGGNLGWLNKHTKFDTFAMRSSCVPIPCVGTSICTEWGDIVNKDQMSKAFGEIIVRSRCRIWLLDLRCK
jgi:hypothetical protein